MDLFSTFFNKITDKNRLSINKIHFTSINKERLPDYAINPIIKYITDFVNMPSQNFYEFMHSNKNFWDVYFNYLKCFSNFNDSNAKEPITDSYDQSMNREFGYRISNRFLIKKYRKHFQI